MSFEPFETRQRYMQAIKTSFEQSAQLLGGNVEVAFKSHGASYIVNNDELLLKVYKDVLVERGTELKMRPTFIGSDTSAFRPCVKAFTISTGVMNEHSVEEYVPLKSLEQIVQDILMVTKKLKE